MNSNIFLMNLIDGYSFGRIVIKGREYDHDVIVYPDRIKPNWWRKEGHRLYPEDLESVIDYKPEYLIIGCGASCRMDVPEETRKYLEDKGIKVIVLNTYEAYKKYNDMVKDGYKVVAALHLTC
jgi:hypothetical protein